jgi:hypothetical protein
MAMAFIILRWLLLVPAYLMITTTWAVVVMDLFTAYHDSLRGTTLDLFLFFCAVLEAFSLCLASAWIAPAYKRMAGVAAILATIGLSLNRWSLGIASEGVTRAIIAEQAAYLVGGLLALVSVSLVGWVRDRRRSTHSFDGAA